MSAFKKAWDFLKDDDTPDERFHELNDPNPTIAFGAAMRNNPRIADMMAQREKAYNTPYSEGGSIHECQNCGKQTDINYDDVYSDEHCSQRCEQGEDPTCRELTGESCNYTLIEQPSYSREYSDAVGSPHHSVTIKCPKCDHVMYGQVGE
jgi:endogenous inhibitor of DNA gyrase (YacG/DUF329 family)